MTLTAGFALLMWFGEVITQRGIGNGMSLIIFASVVSRLPANFATVRVESGTTAMILIGLMFTGLLVAIVFIEQGVRKIPVQFAKRQIGRKMLGGQTSFIPLKVNGAGVISIIFASSVLYLPGDPLPDPAGQGRRARTATGRRSCRTGWTTTSSARPAPST